MFAIIDCNNFYVSCERVFNPALRNKAVIVLSNNDGCVISRSDEAKAIGIKMGEPFFKIKNIINKHNVHVFSSNYTLYGDMSNRVMSVISDFLPDIEVYSIDEAFVKLNMCIQNKDIETYMLELKEKIYKYTGIPVSIGVANTKTLAKAANYLSKKNILFKRKGICIINDFDMDKLKMIPVNEVWGIGKGYYRILNKMKINNAYDFTLLDDSIVRKIMGIQGLKTKKELMGISCINFDNISYNCKKSICTSRSFAESTSDFETLKTAIANFTVRSAEKLRKQNSCTQMITVFIKSNKFKIKEKQYFGIKSIALPVATNISSELLYYALYLLKKIYKSEIKYKKAGVIFSSIINDNHIQLSIFDKINRKKYERLFKTIDMINKKSGKDKVKFAIQESWKKWKIRRNKLSREYTTNWKDIIEIKV